MGRLDGEDKRSGAAGGGTTPMGSPSCDCHANRFHAMAATRMRQILALLLGFAASLPLAAAAQSVPSAAASDTSAVQAAATVSLIDGWPTAEGGRIVAVVIRLAPGWHTYWRVPGEAGIPPRFDWSASTNLASVAYEWPRPKVFDSYGLRSIGYDGTMVLPVRLTPQDPEAPMTVSLSIDFGVCEDICVPAAADVSATLGTGAGPEDRTRIEAALAERAVGPDQAGIAAVTCTLVPSGAGFELAAEVTFASTPDPVPVTVLEAGHPDLWIGETETRIEGRKLHTRAPVEASGAGGPMLERRALRLTLIDPTRVVDIRGCAAPG
jgi:DsbC/DsbD-like thiol-disulfide interchange protein